MSNILWDIEHYEESPALSDDERCFIDSILYDLRCCKDPRTFASEDGGVKPLGFQLRKYFCFKPARQHRYYGLDIRIVFRLRVRGEIVGKNDPRLNGAAHQRNMLVEMAGSRDDCYELVDIAIIRE